MHIINRILTSASRQLAKRSLSLKVNEPLQDLFGRRHDYLRVSLTERCNLRCRYCMPEQGVKLTDAKRCLSLEEIGRLTSLLVNSCGITKIRLTGGEPTVDSKLLPILEHLGSLRRVGLQTVAMTTNGLTMKSKARLYRDAGLDVVNISLDTMRPERFELMTRRQGLNSVLEGLRAALAIGFERVKLNCVVVRGFNLDELADFARLALDLPIEVRFIEFMPFMGNKWAPNALVGYEEMLSHVSAALPQLVRTNEDKSSETSKLFKQPNMLGSIGFITSMTDNFCSGCNRLRLTSDGNLKVCLFGRHETSLRDLIRNGASDRELVRAIQADLSTKKKQHAGMAILQRDVLRPMVKIARRMFSTSSNDNSDSDSEGAIEQAQFSHLNSAGRAKMVNVGAKDRVRRVAMAQGEICVGTSVLDRLLGGTLSEKGDILTVAKVAGLMAAKSTSNLIPMCHHIPLDHIQIDIEPLKEGGTLLVRAKVEAEHRTGVEMECLTAVSLTLLTIYDMCKSVSRNMTITNVRLVQKCKAATAS